MYIRLQFHFLSVFTAPLFSSSRLIETLFSRYVIIVRMVVACIVSYWELRSTLVLRLPVICTIRENFRNFPPDTQGRLSLPKTRTQTSPCLVWRVVHPLPPLNHQDVDSLASPRCFGLAHRIYIFCYQAVIMPVYWYFHWNFPENLALF